MLIKKIPPLLLITALLLALFASTSQASYVPVKELGYAYLEADASYMTIGEEINWQVILPEDPLPYTFKYTLYHNPDVKANEGFQAVSYTKELQGENTFSFIPEAGGKYFLQTEVMDETFWILKLESQPFFSYSKEDIDNPATLPGKLKALGEECLAQNLSSEYEKALWLHDWIIYHADYDEGMTIHHPEGVLLQGSGVCESYALAYQMLLQEVGIKSIYITGYSRGQLHAWTIVSLDDEWYHIDPTWDDPIGGGNENHDYFGMTDALMMRDHDWSYSNFVFPACTSLEYNYNLRNGYLPFEDADGFSKVLSTALSSRETLIKYSYHGSDSYFVTGDEVKMWMDDKAHIYLVQSWGYSGSAFSGQLEVSYGSDEGSSFTEDAEFSLLMDKLLSARETAVKINYTGSDKYYDLHKTIDNWLSTNHRLYDVNSYEYSYTAFAAEITLSYGDYSVFHRFMNDEGLAKALQQAAQDKESPLKLYYDGEDSLYKLSSKLDLWLEEHRDLYSNYSGTSGPFEAELDIDWN